MFPISTSTGRLPVESPDSALWRLARRPHVKTHWVLNVHIPLQGCCGPSEQVRKLHLTKREFAALQKVFNLQVTGSKDAVVRSRLVQRCMELWPGSSREECALKELTPFAYSHVGAEQDKLWWYDFVPDNCGLKRTRNVWTRITTEEEDDEIVVASDSSSPDGPVVSDPPPPEASNQEPAFQPPPGLDIVAEAYDVLGLPTDTEEPADQEDHRVVSTPPEMNPDPLDRDATVHPDEPQADIVRAATVLPGLHPPRIDANNTENVDAAIEGRVTKKQNQCHMPKRQREAILRIGEVACHGLTNDQGKKVVSAIFSKENVLQWLQDTPLHEMKSGKWSPERFWSAVGQLCLEYDPDFMMSVSIKAEPMPAGKPPRMLIADGDKGQVMALLVIKCFEDLLFTVMKSRSIKHDSKYNAIRRVTSTVRMAGRKNVGTMEGDGSAWDTTCTELVRAYCENGVIGHITDIICEYCSGLVPEQWLRAHQHTCNTPVLTLRTSDGLLREIAAIRRSGHRGTSVLNWWVNFCMWTSCVSKTPWLYVNPGVATTEGIDGGKVRFHYSYEGDDSLVALAPHNAKIQKAIEGRWRTAGFNMKLFHRAPGETAEFCGYHIKVGEDGPTSMFMPDLKRTLKNGHTSCSTAAVRAAKDGDMETLKGVAKAKALAYAHAFARHVPTLARKYLQYADELGCEVVWTQEEVWKVYGNDREERESDTELRTRIEEVMVSDETEAAHLAAFDLQITEEEKGRFEGYRWDFSDLKSYTAFANSLPPTWRP